MSGIAGIVNFGGAPVDRELLQSMTQQLALHGTDAQSSWTDARVGLSHALLRTTPESAAERQPLTIGDLTIVADYRIDGREDLLQALSGSGRAPRAHAP